MKEIKKFKVKFIFWIQFSRIELNMSIFILNLKINLLKKEFVFELKSRNLMFNVSKEENLLKKLSDLSNVFFWILFEKFKVKLIKNIIERTF